MEISHFSRFQICQAEFGGNMYKIMHVGLVSTLRGTHIKQGGWGNANEMICSKVFKELKSSKLCYPHVISQS